VRPAAGLQVAARARQQPADLRGDVVEPSCRVGGGEHVRQQPLTVRPRRALRAILRERRPQLLIK